MKNRHALRWLDLLVLVLTHALDPTGGPPKDELPDEPESERTPTSIGAAAPNSGPVLEPAMNAVNGYVRVTYLSGNTRRFYVGHGPDFIAEQLSQAIERGQAMYAYWDKPGHADAKLERIATRLVTRVEVEHLEADIDALYDDEYAYRLVG